MKKCHLLVVSMILLFLSSLAWGEDLPWEMKLPFKEATIQYNLGGNQQGNETLYVKDYGRLRAKHHKATTTVMGTTQKTETLEVIDPDWIYSYNLIEKKGEKTTNPRKLYQAEYSKLNAEEKRNFEKNSKELGTGMMGKHGASVKQNAEKILGYDCDVTTVGGMSTVYLLHGTDIPLRTEVSMMGMKSSNTATKVDTSGSVPSSAFAPPPDVSAQLNKEMEIMMADTIKQSIDTLKRPDGAQKMMQSGPGMGLGGMQKGMAAEGMSKEEQQEMMQQMDAAMKQMKKRTPQQ
jgi:hypothetical protein